MDRKEADAILAALEKYLALPCRVHMRWFIAGEILQELGYGHREARHALIAHYLATETDLQHRPGSLHVASTWHFPKRRHSLSRKLK